jgi:ribosomal protein S12 methylthiotransferase accessory factor
MTEVRADTSRVRARPLDVAVIGTGQVARAVAARGEGRIGYLAVDAVHDLPTGVAGENGHSALVVVSRGLANTGEQAVQEYASVRGVPWLPVHLDTGWITVGPLVRPLRPGCPLCVRRRQGRNRIDAAARRLLRDRTRSAPQGTGSASQGNGSAPQATGSASQGTGSASQGTDDSMVAPMLVTAAARLVWDEVGMAFAGAVVARTDGAILRLSLLDGSVRRHRFLPCRRTPGWGPRSPAGR